jgi:hypothetical protein
MVTKTQIVEPYGHDEEKPKYEKKDLKGKQTIWDKKFSYILITTHLRLL